jgi:hypothetical protein
MSKNTISASAAGLPARRLFIAAGPAAMVFGALHESASSEGEDAALIALGPEFEAAWAHEHHLEYHGSYEDFEAAIGATSALVERIRLIKATTLDGFKIKARALLWCHCGEFGGLPFDATGETTDVSIAGEIIRELLAIRGRQNDV